MRGHAPEARSYALLLATVSLGSVLAPLNSTMLAVALPDIRSAFSIGHAEIGWLVSSYLIAMAVAQPIGGRLGDQLGRSRVFRFGLIAFLALSIAAAAAPSFPLLLLFRTAQALVGAAVIPNGMAMLRESVPSSKLGQSAGITWSVLSTAAAVGPLVGAALLAAGSWRLLFLMNIPLVAVALACHSLLAYPDARADRRSVAIDWPGALSFAAFLACVTFVLNRVSGDSSAYVLAAGIAALVASGTFFLLRQFRSDTPITEWRFFRNRSYSAAAMYVLLSNLVMYTTLLAIPFFIREVQDKSAATSGTLLGMMSVLVAVVSPVAGRLSDRHGRRAPAVAGSLVALGGASAMAVGIATDVSYWYLALTLATLGLGLGLSIGPASTAAIESAPRALAGVAAGTNSMMRYLGSIVGAGVLGAVLSRDAGTPDIAVFRVMFGIVAIMAVLALVATLFIERFPLAEHDDRIDRVEAPAPQAPAASSVGAARVRTKSVG